MKPVDIAAPIPPPPPPADASAPAAEAPDDDQEGFGGTDEMLLDAVSKMEWKNIEQSLSHNKKTVALMLKRSCAQVRTKGDLERDESNGKFLGDMLTEMDNFATWCYTEHIRPKLIELLPIELEEEEEEEDPKKKKKGGKPGAGGGKPGAGGGKKGGGGKAAIPAKTQIKLDNVLRIMKGESAKKGASTMGVGAHAMGWLEALEAGKNLVLDAPWELQLAKEMGTAAALLGKKEKGTTKEESEEKRYRNVRNLADAIVIFETQYKQRYGVDELPPLQLLSDARFVLGELKVKTKFTVSKCLRKHPHLLSTSQFKSRHAAKFLQPYSTQLDLFKSIVKPGPRLVLLRSPPDTGKTSLAPALPELFPEQRVVFCCLARRVNLEVAQTLYNMGIPFAWVHNKQVTCSWLCGLRGASTSTSIAQMEEKLRVGVEKLQETQGGLSNTKVRKRNAQVIRPPRCFVSDVASCAWLTKQLEPDKTVLMIDEPTMGADQGHGEALPPSSLTGLMTQAMLAAPYKTIWSSATLPPGNTIPTLINKFKERFSVGDEAVDELVSMQLNVGVLLVRPNGQVALPHAICAVEGEGEKGASAALSEFITRLKTEPLLLKAYTAQAISTMEDRLSADDVKPLAAKAKMEVPQIDEHFEDLSKLSHGSLRQYAVLILEKLAATKDDKLIQLACTPSKDASQALFPPFDAPKLLLQNAHKFPGMTLTVSSDPKEQIGATSEALVKEMPSLKKLNKEIEAAEEAYRKRIDGIRKEAEKVKGGEDRIEEIVSAKLREMGLSEGAGPGVKIPEHCVVNSRAHLRKYAGAQVAEEMDGGFIRIPPSNAELKEVGALPVDETWAALLLAGVAAHMPHDPVLNPAGDISYTNYVANKMEHGQLAVCGVTKDFTYGANVPCTSVLVDKDFLLKHSANTLRQFIGRVARTGLAPFGIAQFEDDAFLEKMCGKNNQEEALCMEATAKAICKLVDAGEELS
jgi:hypothetical protein|eukprot:jgi/Chrpa1/3765/Chrysochromulina_OHIO_Genome00018392-RA